MATSKEQLLQKIDNLLIDINEQYITCKASDACGSAELHLLAAHVDFLSAHIKTLHFYSDGDRIEAKGKETVHKIDKDTVPAEEKVVEEVAEDKSADEKNFEEKSTTPSEVSHATEEQKIEKTEEVVAEQRVEERPQYTPAETLWNTGGQSPAADATPRQEVVPEPVSEEPVAQTAEPVVNRIVEEKKEVIIEQPAATVEQEKPNRPLTLNELIQQQRKAGANLTQQFNTSSNQDKIVDLKTAVSLNDKLLFIKDLFNGYSLAYNEAIELLNKYDSFAEADAFLQTSYAVKNGWSSKPQTVDKFYTILHKKFMN